MISKEDHQQILRCLSALGTFANAGCRDIVFMMDAFPRSSIANIERQAREGRIPKQEVLREALIRGLKTDKFRAVADEPDNLIATLQKPDEAELSPPVSDAFKEALKRARVFEIPHDVFVTLLNESRSLARRDMRSAVTAQHGPDWGRRFEAIMNRGYEQVSEAIVTDNHEAIEVAKKIQSVLLAMETLPLPELPSFDDQRPFDSCIFFSSSPIRMMRERTGYKRALPTNFLSTFGMLASTDLVVMLEGSQADTFYDFRPDLLWWKGQWKHAAAGIGPRILDALCRLTRSHRGLIDERKGLGEKLLQDKLKKHGLRLPAPSPFYAVNVDSSYIHANRASILPRHPPEWSHRWDVVRHTMMKVERGKLPLDPAERKKLIKRGYEIFEETEPSADVVFELGRRQVPLKQPDEWMAVLLRWRRDYVKGPEGKPYIPAARRVREEPKT